MNVPRVSPREKELANDVLCRWIPAGTETLPQPVHRCWILFLLTSQSQADPGKMDHSYCAETEFLWLLGIQLHHMFSGSPSHVLPWGSTPASAEGQGWSCTSRVLLHPPRPAWLQPLPLTSLPDCLSCHRLLWLFVVACIPSRKHFTADVG